MAKFMYYFLFVFWQFQNQLKLLSNFLDKQLIYMEIKWKRKCIIGQGQAHNKCSCVMNMHESQLSSCTNLHVKIIKVKKGINEWIDEKGEGRTWKQSSHKPRESNKSEILREKLVKCLVSAPTKITEEAGKSIYFDTTWVSVPNPVKC